MNPSSIIYGDMTARALVEIVDELRERVAILEGRLSAVEETASDAADDASGASARLEQLIQDLEGGEYSA